MQWIDKEKKPRFRWLVGVALAGLLVGLGTGGYWERTSGGSLLQASARAESPEIAAASQERPNFVALATRLKPVVVNISTTQVVESQEAAESPFGGNDPFDEFWRKFFGQMVPRGTYRQKSLGSGFIIDRDGYILTNNHVVDNAEKITVSLSDGREFEAKLVGKDPKTDVALVKINAKGDLPVAPLGDSGKLEVGEWVLAIGNPFGLDNTVTAGIVSAKGRHIGNGPYDDFIQTDASINPGNSGGPLINLGGEIVGINTAIYSQSGGNIGIGFAIPINLVKEILPQLKSKGKVTRGWLGVVIQRVTPAIAESMGLDKPKGALVADVAKDGPADRAGIKVSDVIVGFDGKEIKESSDLPILVARTAPSKRVQVRVLRDKKELTLMATLEELKEETVASAQEGEGLGLTAQKVTPQLAESFGLKRAEGVVIVSVEPGSAADEAGLQRSDVILEINRKPIRDLSDYRKAIKDATQGKEMLFLVHRGDTNLFVALRSPL